MAKHLTSAQKRAAMRSTPEEDPEFQIAPMIDILLVLLVFFMSISSTEVLQTNDSVKLPIAKDSKDRQKKDTKGQSIVNVLWNPINNTGSLDMDQHPYLTAQDIVPVLQAKVNANPEMRVLVRADKNVRYEYMRTLLKAVGDAGIGNVTFSVVDKEVGAPAGEAPAAP